MMIYKSWIEKKITINEGKKRKSEDKLVFKIYLHTKIIFTFTMTYKWKVFSTH